MPPPGQPAAAEKDAQPPSDVTVFSKHRANKNAPWQTSISLTEASSCAFGTTTSDVVSGLPAGDTTVGLRIMALMNDDEAAQNYFQNMGVENPNAEVDAMMGVNPLMPGARSDQGARLLQGGRRQGPGRCADDARNLPLQR